MLFAYGVTAEEYFGKNKVQYQQFAFREIKTPHFNVLCYTNDSVVISTTLLMLERWYTRYRFIFKIDLPKLQPVIIYNNHADFQQTNAIDGLIPEGTGGVTEGFLNRMIIPLTGNNRENDHVLGHELVHAFQISLLDELKINTSGFYGAPLWFTEGMSEYLSIGSHSPLTSMWMRDAVLNNDIPEIDDLNNYEKYFPYRFGHAIWAFIAGTYGDSVIYRLFLDVVQNGLTRGLENTLGLSTDSLSSLWKTSLINTYGTISKMQELDTLRGEFYAKNKSIVIAPKLSPDGRYVAVFSSEDNLSIDLYLLDATTGKTLKKLANTDTDRYFEALSFINAAGAWSPDSKRFAFVVYTKGNNGIGIVDISSGKYKETIAFDTIDQISELAFSPDGNQMAFSGSSVGHSDLYLYNLKDKSVNQLTKDIYADRMPSWSPDGKKIVFSTDRGVGTSVDSLQFSNYKIGIYVLSSRAVSTLSIAPFIYHNDPQYSASGDTIYFVANANGISNVYSYSFVDNIIKKQSDFLTGVSGLTEISPSMSICTENNRCVVTVFNKKRFELVIFNLHSNDTIQKVATKEAFLAQTVLPPLIKNNPVIDRYLNDTDHTFTAINDIVENKYHPELKLLYVGQLFGGLTTNFTGANVGAGISFLFSDMLGNHVVGATVQGSTAYRNFGGELVYYNQKGRLHWGGVVSRIPYVSTEAIIENSTDSIDGDIRESEKITYIDKYISDNNIGVLADYPLSINRRFEFTTYYTLQTFRYRTQEITVSENSILSDRTKKIDAPDASNLIQNSIAFVGDFSTFGFTGPINGRRFRFETQLTTGSLFYTSLLADYRQYIYSKSFTIAVRATHTGRYLKDANNRRVPDLFLGYETSVRGYEYHSFNLADCSDSNAACIEFDRLFGSRLGIFNIECRYPLIGNSSFGLFNFPYLPTDLFLFFDGGVAWSGHSRPSMKLVKNSSDRVPVFSLGLGSRFNILGLLILQTYYAYPFQRNDKRGHFGFVFAPAW
jgi:hypothetical protein